MKKYRFEWVHEDMGERLLDPSGFEICRFSTNAPEDITFEGDLAPIITELNRLWTELNRLWTIAEAGSSNMPTGSY